MGTGRVGYLRREKSFGASLAECDRAMTHSLLWRNVGHKHRMLTLIINPDPESSTLDQQQQQNDLEEVRLETDSTTVKIKAAHTNPYLVATLYSSATRYCYIQHKYSPENTTPAQPLTPNPFHLHHVVTFVHNLPRMLLTGTLYPIHNPS